MRMLIRMHTRGELLWNIDRGKKKRRFLESFARGRLMGGARKILESHTKITGWPRYLLLLLLLPSEASLFPVSRVPPRARDYLRYKVDPLAILFPTYSWAPRKSFNNLSRGSSKIARYFSINFTEEALFRFWNKNIIQSFFKSTREVIIESCFQH